MDIRSEAEKLASRPYIFMTSVDTTTAGHPVHFARVYEIEGCFGQGDTREEAIDDLRLALVDFIESLLEDELPVPGPAEISPTFGTAAKGSYTFIREGRKLQPKPVEARKEAYILAP
jgi:predicted RNase H-like HicB family nuclease